MASKKSLRSRITTWRKRLVQGDWQKREENSEKEINTCPDYVRQKSGGSPASATASVGFKEQGNAGQAVPGQSPEMGSGHSDCGF